MLFKHPCRLFSRMRPRIAAIARWQASIACEMEVWSSLESDSFLPVCRIGCCRCDAEFACEGYSRRKHAYAYIEKQLVRHHYPFRLDWHSKDDSSQLSAERSFSWPSHVQSKTALRLEMSRAKPLVNCAVRSCPGGRRGGAKSWK